MGENFIGRGSVYTRMPRKDGHYRRGRRRRSRRRRSLGLKCGEGDEGVGSCMQLVSGWDGRSLLKLRFIGTKEIKLTAPRLLVSDVTTPCDEIVALQKVHELWIGQSTSKFLVSARKFSKIKLSLPLELRGILMFVRHQDDTADLQLSLTCPHRFFIASQEKIWQHETGCCITSRPQSRG